MPHLIIEYSRNLEEDCDIAELVAVAHKTAQASPVFNPVAVRTRAIPVDHYLIADGDPARAFIQLYIRIKPGRPTETKMELGRAVHQAVKDFLASTVAGRGLAFNVEVQDVADTSVRFRSWGKP